MKARLLNSLLLVFSLFGYLEWGHGNRSFLFEAEWKILSGLFTEPLSAAHPFILLPMAGQILLICTLFQKRPGKIPTLISIACLGLLLGFMLITGLISHNIRITASALPFLITAVITSTRHLRAGSISKNTG